MEILTYLLVFTVGTAAGAIAAAILNRRKIKQLEEKSTQIEKEKAGIEAAKSHLAGENSSLKELNADLNRKIIDLEKTVSAFDADKRNLEEKIKTHEKDIERLNRELTVQFENLAAKILEANSTKFLESSSKNIKTILDPLRERIQQFQDRVERTYSDEARERIALKTEIENIVKTNQRMSEETSNLTKALKGDIKTQGNWGEFMLEKILEASGLREGEEYTTQGRNLKLKSADGRIQKPDVVVHLPDSKHVIVDSKVSLTAYERYANATDETVREDALRDFLGSIVRHIDDLAGKEYYLLDKLISPDFVVMFLAVEPAFSLALQKKQDLVSYAWNKGVALVSPTTLFTTLKTVASLWKVERQNRNALEIANRGGKLYEKFVLLIEDLEKLGSSLDNTRRCYDAAFNKLRDGRGNLISQVEKLRSLGAKTAKKIDQKYLIPDDEPVNGEIEKTETAMEAPK